MLCHDRRTLRGKERGGLVQALIAYVTGIGCTVAIRFVIKGYRQIKDVSFTGLHSSKSLSFTSYTARLRIPVWVEIDHMDVTTASLHPEIRQPNVLMNPPELRGLGALSEFSIHAQASSGTASMTV